jgi:lysophospholipase L1-like esterase
MCQHSNTIDRQGITGHRKLDLTRSFAVFCAVSAGAWGIVAPIGCATAPSEKSLSAPPSLNDPPSVVFIGDSITWIWGNGQEGSEFAEHPNWIDKGVGGQNSSQVLARFQTDAIDLNPGIVHILVGTNDVYPGWTLVPSNANAINSAANVEAMVQMAQANGIHIILATIPPWGCDASKCAPAETADRTLSRYERIDTWNAWIEQYGLSQGIPVVDYHSALVAPDGEHYVPDLTIEGVHPSAAGYVIMTLMVEKVISEISSLYASKQGPASAGNSPPNE